MLNAADENCVERQVRRVAEIKLNPEQNPAVGRTDNEC